MFLSFGSKPRPELHDSAGTSSPKLKLHELQERGQAPGRFPRRLTQWPRARRAQTRLSTLNSLTSFSTSQLYASTRLSCTWPRKTSQCSGRPADVSRQTFPSWLARGEPALMSVQNASALTSRYSSGAPSASHHLGSEHTPRSLRSATHGVETPPVSNHILSLALARHKAARLAFDWGANC